MAIMAKSEKDFTPAPEGQFQAVCCDVVDLGIKKETWGNEIKERQKVRVAFQINETNPEDGKPFLVTEQFTLSMYRNSRLRKFLESWRGKPYTDDEATVGVDIELMVNVNAFIQIVHSVHNGSTYANVDTIMKAPKGSPVLEVRDYVRVKDRETRPDPQSNEPPPSNPPEDDFYNEADDPDPLPF